MKFEKPYLEILLFDEVEMTLTSTNTTALEEAKGTILGQDAPAQAAVSVDINDLTIR